MPASKDLGRLFLLTIKVTSAAGWIWTAPTFEIEPPFRVCNRCLVVRIKPFRTALVLGWWRDSGLDEEAALRQALAARVVDLDEIRDSIMADQDLDAEWRVMTAYGLDRDDAS
jgi:hypothetical protein